MDHVHGLRNGDHTLGKYEYVVSVTRVPLCFSWSFNLKVSCVRVDRVDFNQIWHQIHQGASASDATALLCNREVIEKHEGVRGRQVPS